MLQQEQENKELIRYWNGIKAGRLFPSENDIDPDMLGDIWQSSFLLQLRDLQKVKDYNYSYLGPNIIKAYESESLTHVVPGLVHLDAKHLAVQLEEVCELRQPMVSSGKHHMPDGTLVRYCQCLLPLGYEDGVVHSILGHMGYEVYPDMQPI